MVEDDAGEVAARIGAERLGERFRGVEAVVVTGLGGEGREGGGELLFRLTGEERRRQ